MNNISSKRAPLKEIVKVTNSENFHDFFIQLSLKRVFNLSPDKNLKSILSLGSSYVEAKNFIKFPFKKIVLSGIYKPNKNMKEIIKKDKRICYAKQDIENVSYKSASFDIVFVKEALHHIPRPIKGLYEMLRVAKKAIVFIEPKESVLGNILDFFNLSSKYERNHNQNKKNRDNFVYRWKEKEILKILNSYYLDSGYKVEFINCWMSNRFNMRFKSLIKLFNLFGWLISFIPGNKGNYLICIIIPGKDLP